MNVEEFIYSQPKLIQELFLLYFRLCFGYRNFKENFETWKFIMTNDLNRLNKKYCGLTIFDEFYATLNGSWRGVDGMYNEY